VMFLPVSSHVLGQNVVFSITICVFSKHVARVPGDVLTVFGLNLGVWTTGTTFCNTCRASVGIRIFLSLVMSDVK
jgi:hypothetical protein